MKPTKSILITAMILATCNLHAAQSEQSYQPTTNEFRAVGGPDAYGYTWADSDEIGGPAFNWIDITVLGTEITGLADDNSVPLIPMGMSFQYYWSTFSQVKVGSNGWLSFDDVSNVAHCFPTIPTAGGSGDNLIAPFMSDLTFTEAGNPAQAFYYYDAMAEQFIISYIDVPWWTASAPGFIGSNTFQVIFSAVDNSITLQYEDVDQANFNNTAGCFADLEIGFENSTGNIGLEILNEQVPADSYAIKITYPDVVLIDIEDPTPVWNQNADNKGVFGLAGDDINVVTHVKNAGNADTTTAIDVTMNVFDEFNMSIYSEVENIAGLMSQEGIDVNYLNPLNGAAGNYRLEATSTSVSDINPSNNTNNSELNLVDQSVSPSQLSYVTDNINTGSLSWNGGTGGVGVFYQPPYSSWHIDSIEMFIATGGGIGGDYTVGIYANDGVNGLPGTLLSSVDVLEGSYTLDSWVLTQLPAPIIAPDNGFFVSWEQNANEGMAIGHVTAAPISRQSYEMLSGQWATYRANEVTEFMIRVNMIDLIFANDFE